MEENFGYLVALFRAEKNRDSSGPLLFLFVPDLHSDDTVFDVLAVQQYIPVAEHQIKHRWARIVLHDTASAVARSMQVVHPEGNLLSARKTQGAGKPVFNPANSRTLRFLMLAGGGESSKSEKIYAGLISQNKPFLALVGLLAQW